MMTNVLRLHRRLAVLLGICGLLAFAGGAGFEPLAATLAACGLLLALFWQPGPTLGARLDRIWMAGATLLVVRALYYVFVVGGDVVVPVVDLLLLLLCTEALRPLEAKHDSRLYSLSFALLVASAAYRPGLLFAIAFVAYVSIATVALMLGHLRREAERHHVTELRIGHRFLSATAALSGITLAMSAVVFLAFPRVSRGWMGRGMGFATAIAGFSDEISLAEHGARFYPNPEIVLRVEFPDGRASGDLLLYWRGRSYDRFDATRWSRSSDLPPSAPARSWYARRWPGTVERHEIYSAPLDVRVLFVPHPVVGLDTHVPIRVVTDNAGDLAYFGPAEPAYTTRSISGRPDARVLRDLPDGPTPASRFYLQLPPLSPRIRALADSLATLADTRYDQVRNVERWLQTEFTYTLELPRTPAEATLDHFLFERRQGHCEYFSTAMVVLLRAMGVPARNVNGFLGGDWNEFGNYLAVTQNDAHSWVEVWFPDIGWVSFDPTPAGGGAGALATAWFWPGRLWLDGMQHRWNKWVLDYSLQKQVSLFQRTAGLFATGQDAPEVMAARRTLGRLPRTLVGMLGGLAAAALVLTAVMSRRRGPPRETRLYLSLRRLYGRAGFLDRLRASPLEFLQALRARQAPGCDHAEVLVNLYLEARFSGADIGDPGRERMAHALSAARNALSAARTARAA